MSVRDAGVGLPADVTSFVDRRHEVTEVRRLLSVSRLVTLTGMGGAGKTRLALRVAAESRRAFPQGAWLVDLAPLHDGSLVTFAVSEALGIRDETDRKVADVVAGHLRDRRLLLVLDNCEHLLDACAEFAAVALRTSAELRILCTSRQPLGVLGECVWTVPPMQVPDPVRAFTAAGPNPRPPTRYSALTLFADRAAEAAPGFVLCPDNAEVVAEICRRLDGLPLAIELAAARLRMLSVGQLEAALRDRFPALTSRHAVPAHHRTLQATFDWSFELCSPAERSLWCRMSVFVDSFDFAAAADVCRSEDPGSEPILETLAGLVDKSVLTREEVAGQARYRLLETVRQYGLERLRARDGDESALRRRHQDWYRRLAARFNADWFGPDQQVWATRMRYEHPNMRAVLDHSLDADARVEHPAGLALAADLISFWYASGLMHEARYWLERALALNPQPAPARCRALAAYGRILVAQGELARARSAAAELIDLGRQLGDQWAIVRGTGDLGIVALMSNDLPGARTLLEQALGGLTEPGEDFADLAVVQCSLAMTMFYLGDLGRAAELCADSQATCKARGDRSWLAFALNTSALMALAQGDLATASEHLRESLRLRAPLDDRLGMAGSIERLAWTAAAYGNYERAAVLLGAAHRLWQAIGRMLYGAAQWLRGHEECEARCRAELAEAAYERAFCRGAGLGTAEAIRYALEPERPPAAHAHVDTTGAGAEPGPDAVAMALLTRRERQVAQLIAQGMSNRQIAARLVVSQRTAESHVENILRKVGFTSRTQVAAWISRQEGDGTG